MKNEYILDIDAFTPRTLPLKRFVEYVSDLARILGNGENVHFDRIEEGSVKAVARVDDAALDRVHTRLSSISSGDGPQEALSAVQELNEKLVEDKAYGRLLNQDGAVIIEFPGRKAAPKETPFPAFYENTTIDGVLTSLSGSDDTKHAQMVDSDQKYTGLETKDLELLGRLKEHLWGNPIRLFGRGRFLREADGSWRMSKFIIDDFEVLEKSSFAETITALRQVRGGIEVNAKLLNTLQEERDEGLDEA